MVVENPTHTIHLFVSFLSVYHMTKDYLYIRRKVCPSRNSVPYLWITQHEFTKMVRQAIDLSTEVAKENKQHIVQTEHLMKALLEQKMGLRASKTRYIIWYCNGFVSGQKKKIFYQCSTFVKDMILQILPNDDISFPNEARLLSSISSGKCLFR